MGSPLDGRGYKLNSSAAAFSLPPTSHSLLLDRPTRSSARLLRASSTYIRQYRTPNTSTMLSPSLPLALLILLTLLALPTPSTAAPLPSRILLAESAHLPLRQLHLSRPAPPSSLHILKDDEEVAYAPVESGATSVDVSESIFADFILSAAAASSAASGEAQESPKATATFRIPVKESAGSRKVKRTNGGEAKPKSRKKGHQQKRKAKRDLLERIVVISTTASASSPSATATPAVIQSLDDSSATDAAPPTSISKATSAPALIPSPSPTNVEARSSSAAGGPGTLSSLTPPSPELTMPCHLRSPHSTRAQMGPLRRHRRGNTARLRLNSLFCYSPS